MSLYMYPPDKITLPDVNQNDLDDVQPIGRRMVRIEAKVVRHSRYVTFQMAEVLVSKSLFHEILAEIHRLRPVPIG